MTHRWGREEAPELAVERILDAAGKAFGEHGLPAAGMGEIAAAAGCSRGTLYRYFRTRHDLHRAYVDREAARIGAKIRAETAPLAEPRRRLAEAVLVAVREVRADPGTAAWFAPGASGVAARMSRASEVVGALTDRFVAELLGPDPRDPEAGLLARWLVRVVVSLLAMPAGSEAEERALVERFVAPALDARGGGEARRP